MSKTAIEHERVPIKKFEMETAILRNAQDRIWDIVTNDPTIIRKLEKLGWKSKSGIHEWGEKRFILPNTRLGFRRPVTEAAKEKGRAMFRKANKNA